MFNSFKKKSAADRIRIADKSTQELINKRSKLDPITDEKKIIKINNKIHKNNVETNIAYTELGTPKTEINKTNNYTSFSYNKNEKNLNLHGHYHASKKK